MTNVSLARVAKRLGAMACLPAVWVLSGCGNGEIKTYRVAKEDNTPVIPSHVHTADDGHDHGDDTHARPNAALPKLAWTLPEGWKELPPDGMRKAVFQVPGPDGKLAQVMVIPLPGASNIEMESVNMWREELGLKPLSRSEVSAQAEAVDLGGAKGQLYEMTSAEARPGQSYKIRTLGAIAPRDNVLWFAKMSGEEGLVAQQKAAFVGFLKSLQFGQAPETTAGPSSSYAPAGAEAPKWTVPSHWQEKTPGPMVNFAWEVTGSEGQADVTVIKLPGAAGGLVGNVNRWRGQIGLAPLPDAEVRASTEMLEIGGQKDAYISDLKGTHPRTGKPGRMITIAVPRGADTWFYKILGDEALVAKERETLLKFVTGAY